METLVPRVRPCTRFSHERNTYREFMCVRVVYIGRCTLGLSCFYMYWSDFVDHMQVCCCRLYLELTLNGSVFCELAMGAGPLHWTLHMVWHCATGTAHGVALCNRHCTWYGTVKQALHMAWHCATGTAHGMALCNRHCTWHGTVQQALHMVWHSATGTAHGMTLCNRHCTWYGTVQQALHMVWHCATGTAHQRVQMLLLAALTSALVT
jgi:predicted membrane protein